MRGHLSNIWFGGEEQQLTAIFSDFLRTPGLHPMLDMWMKIAKGEPLVILYNTWDESNKTPDVEIAGRYIEVMVDRYNVYVGKDVSNELEGTDLFYHDLTELCEAVDTWLISGELTGQQVSMCEAAANYYRSNGGINPGALNIVRGWFELLQVVRDHKRIIRCIADDCNKLLMITPESELLSGTVDGYHNQECMVKHTEGGEDEDIDFKQLPGNEDLREVVGNVQEAENVADNAAEDFEG